MKFNLSLNVIFICGILLVSTIPAFSATYYVKNGGNDLASGLSDANAWATTSKVNKYANTTHFVSGDIIQFKRGSTWSKDETIGYSGGSFVVWGTVNGLTIQDYGTGALPRFDCNAQQAMAISSSTISNLVIKNLDISGMDWTAGCSATSGNMLFDGKINGLILDGIYADGHKGASFYRRHDGFILIYVVYGNIEIKNCTLINGYKDTFANTRSSWGSNDFPGVLIWYSDGGLPKLSGTVSIHDNVINHVYSDCIGVEGVQTTTNIYNNTLSEFGENAVDSKAGRYHNIHHNTVAWNNFGHSAGSDYYGSVAFTGVTSPDFAAYPVRDLTYDSNTISNGSIGIYVLSSSGSTISNNYFKDLYSGIIIETGGWTITGNIFDFSEPLVSNDPGQPALAASPYWSAMSFRFGLNNININKNYIGIFSSNHRYGIYWDINSGRTGNSITENKIRMTRNNSLVYPLYILNSYKPNTINSNDYYGVHANRVYYNGVAYNNQATWTGVSGVSAMEIFTAQNALDPKYELSTITNKTVLTPPNSIRIFNQ